MNSLFEVENYPYNLNLTVVVVVVQGKILSLHDFKFPFQLVFPFYLVFDILLEGFTLCCQKWD